MRKQTTSQLNQPAEEVKEEKIICPVCIAPECMMESNIKRTLITDEDDEFLTEESIVESYLCQACGYTSNSYLELKGEMVERAESTSPRLVVDLAFEDKERGIKWFPSVVNFPTIGLCYPDGTSDDWKWKVAPYEKLTKEEQDKYLSEGNKEYTHRLMVEEVQEFENTDFKSALALLQSIVKKHNEPPTVS